MIEVKTSELIGAQLDWAVAIATEAWKGAHTLYPAMTLDPSFSGVELRPYPRGEFGSLLLTCVLVPNNPFRQDPQPFCPSSAWKHGGPLLDAYWPLLNFCRGQVRAEVAGAVELGETYLIAACRAIVASKLGDTVQIPQELMP